MTWLENKRGFSTIFELVGYTNGYTWVQAVVKTASAFGVAGTHGYNASTVYIIKMVGPG